MPSRPGRFSGARARQRALALCLLLPPLLPAAGRAEGWSLGLGYPSVSVKYDLKAVAFEGKYISGSGVQACAGRGYWNFYRVAGLNGFAGLEAGYIDFNALDTKGTGGEIALFAGGEYFLTEKLSLLMDLSPTLIALRSGGRSTSYVAYVVNMGFYYHFGGPRPAREAEQYSGPDAETWLEQLKSRNWKERRKAAFQLGKVKAPQAAEPLLDLLDDENEKVRGAAALALGRLGDKRAGKPLIKELENRSPYVRALAAKALGTLGDKRAVNPLEKALKDEAKEVRKAAAAALGKIRPAP